MMSRMFKPLLLLIVLAAVQVPALAWSNHTLVSYRAFDRMGLGGDFQPRAAPQWASIAEAIASVAGIGNRLERPACSLLRQIDDILAMLNRDRRVEVAAMSGSGATVFALAASMEAAASIADDVQQRRPDWWVADTLLGGA